MTPRYLTKLGLAGRLLGVKIPSSRSLFHNPLFSFTANTYIVTAITHSYFQVYRPTPPSSHSISPVTEFVGQSKPCEAPSASQHTQSSREIKHHQSHQIFHHLLGSRDSNCKHAIYSRLVDRTARSHHRDCRLIQSRTTLSSERSHPNSRPSATFSEIKPPSHNERKA